MQKIEKAESENKKLLEDAVRLYKELQSLGKVAEVLNISHIAVRNRIKNMKKSITQRLSNLMVKDKPLGP